MPRLAFALLIALAALPGARAADCSDAASAARQPACVRSDFDTASDELAQRVRRLRAALPSNRRLAFSQAQTAWLNLRTRQCVFESGVAEDRAAATAVQWRCAARLTRARNAELAALETSLGGGGGAAR